MLVEFVSQASEARARQVALNASFLAKIALPAVPAEFTITPQDGGFDTSLQCIIFDIEIQHDVCRNPELVEMRSKRVFFATSTPLLAECNAQSRMKHGNVVHQRIHRRDVMA
jgi:hypothetical protein